jgi:hypothetical protein
MVVTRQQDHTLLLLLQGEAPGCKGSYVVLSGRLSDVRGFNDFLQDFLVQVRMGEEE